MTAARWAIVVTLLTGAGCAVHKPQNYRVIQQGGAPVLMPPGIAAPDLATRTFSAEVAGPCPRGEEAVAMRPRKRRAVVTVNRSPLEKQRPGWLSEWTAGLESQGCLAPGAGIKLADRIAESLPLGLASPFRLLYASQSDLGPRVRIQVVSPVLREGARSDAPILEPVETKPNGAGLTIAIKSSPDFIGYETAWYGVEARPNRGGFKISPLYAERRIGPSTERRPQPAVNYFPFPPDAGFYRLFFKAEQSEFTALVVAARTPAELERRFAMLEAGPASCQALNGELCITIPKLVAVNPVLVITVNGRELPVRLGATVGEAIRTAGERQPNAVLPRLAVYRPYDNRPVAVEFDRASPAILNLILTGGETLVWLPLKPES